MTAFTARSICCGVWGCDQRAGTRCGFPCTRVCAGWVYPPRPTPTHYGRSQALHSTLHISRAPPRTWSLQGASAALSGTAGRSRSWSVPGQGLAHTYEVDPDRQAAHRWPACCPRPTKGSSRRARWRPRAAQKRSPPGSRQALTAVLIRYEPAALPSPRRRRFFWSCLHLNFSAFSPLAGGGEQPCMRTRTSCGCSDR